MRAIIKQFLADIAEFRRNFQESTKSKEIASQFSTSAFTEEKFIRVFFAFIKHIKNDSSITEKILII